MKTIKEKYNFKKKKIFVLGGSGLIGNEVCKELSDFKTNILNLDIKEKKPNLKNINLHILIYQTWITWSLTYQK